MDALVQELGGRGLAVADLALVSKPRVSARSVLYIFGTTATEPKYVVKQPRTADAVVDTDPPQPAAAQFEALVRSYQWHQEEDRHSVVRPVALLEPVGAFVMEYAPGSTVGRAIKRAVLSPDMATAAVAAAGEYLRRFHRHAHNSDAEVELRVLVEEILALEAATGPSSGDVQLPEEVQRALGAVPRTSVLAPQVLLHGDFVPDNLILTDRDQVTMIDPLLIRVGLPEDDVARFLCVLSSDTVFVPGSALPMVRRLRRRLESAFCASYGLEPSALWELRLIKQYMLRWLRRREFSRLAGHPALMSARRRLVDLHMRSLLNESGRRLQAALPAEHRCR